MYWPRVISSHLPLSDRDDRQGLSVCILKSSWEILGTSSVRPKLRQDPLRCISWFGAAVNSRNCRRGWKGRDKDEKGTDDRERSNEGDPVYRHRNGSSQWILVNTHAALLLRSVRSEEPSPSKRGIRSTLSLGLAVPHLSRSSSVTSKKLYGRDCVSSEDFGASNISDRIYRCSLEIFGKLLELTEMPDNRTTKDA